MTKLASALNRLNFLMKDREDRQNRQNRQDRQNRQERQERQDGQDRQTLSGYVGRYLTILVRTILLNFIIFPLWQRNEPSFQIQTNALVTNSGLEQSYVIVPSFD